MKGPFQRPGVAVIPARGQSAVEYLVVVSLLALALVVGPDSPLERLFRAFAAQYAEFSYAMSRP